MVDNDIIKCNVHTENDMGYIAIGFGSKEKLISFISTWLDNDHEELTISKYSPEE